MRKEILGILLFFLVIFTLISLLSFNPADPSIHNAGANEPIRNLFGLLGAHLAGLLIGLFGMGAFWLPPLLMLASIHFFGNQPNRTFLSIAIGGLLLILATGSLLALRHHDYVLFGNRFSSGGLIGISIKSFLIQYTNHAGSLIILLLLWIIGFILATRVSLIALGRRIWSWLKATYDSLLTVYLKFKERRQKTKKRVDRQQTTKVKKKVKIESVPIKPIKTVPPPKQEEFEFMQTGKGYHLPPFSFLEDPEERPVSVDPRVSDAVPAPGKKARRFRCPRQRSGRFPRSRDYDLRIRAGTRH